MSWDEVYIDDLSEEMLDRMTPEQEEENIEKTRMELVAAGYDLDESIPF